MTSTRRAFLNHAGVGALATMTLGCRVDRATAPPSDPAAAFFAAVGAGDLETVSRELQRSPQLLDALDARGRSGFSVALLAGQAATADLLRQRGYQPDLVECAWVGDWERFEALAGATPEVVEAVNTPHPLGGAAMYAAARGGRGSDLWRVFAQGGLPNPQRSDPTLHSPLRAALEVSSLADAEMSAATLLSNGADPNADEPEGSTSLHAAARRGSLVLVEMLIRKGARVDARDRRGLTARDLAERAGESEVASLLGDHAAIARDHVASRRACTADGQPYRPPSLADITIVDQQRFVGLGHFSFDELRERLAAEPRLVHATATTTEMAVEASGHTGRADICRYLLERGAPMSTPAAVLLGDTRQVDALLKAEPARIHERGPHDFALLWYPVLGGGMIDMTELLLERGAEVEAQSYLGTTALHFAAMGGQREMVALLLERGADINRVGRKFAARGQTPYQLAMEREQHPVADLLRERGARTD